MEEKLKTGTTTVAIKGKDFVVIAADRRGSMGNFVPHLITHKVIPITEKMAVTIAGHASEGQLLSKYLKSELRLMELKINRPVTVKEAANLLSGWTYSALRSRMGIAHFLMAGYDSEGRIFDVGADGTLDELNDFASSGSGSVHAISVLDTQYKPNMSENDAVQLVKRCLLAAMTRDTYSGNGYDVYVINAEGMTHKLSEAMLPIIN